MKQYKDNRRGLVVTIIILIVLILGEVLYICYDKFSDDITYLYSKNKESSKESLIMGNSFPLDNENCLYDGDTCIKDIKVSYDDKNHSVKIKLIKDSESSVTSGYSNLKYEIYIDDKFVDSFEAGNIKDSMIVRFDATVYVVSNKYIAILTERQFANSLSNYVLTYYNNDSRIDEDVLIKLGGQGLSLNSNLQPIINDLDDLVFDGDSFSFWAEKCSGSEKVGVKYKLIFDGSHIKRKIIDTVNPIYVVGTSC